MRLLFIVIFLNYAIYSWCISAYPYPVRVSTESGYTYITLCGNEHQKYALTEDGYTVLQGESGWFFACLNDQGEVVASPYPIEKKDMRSSALKAFLDRQKKGILPNISIDKRNIIQQKSSAGEIAKVPKPVLGNRKALVVLMEFKDVKFTKNSEDFDKLFNQEGYSYDGASGSVFDYYKYVSYGQLSLKCTILGPYTAKHDMSYYGTNWGISSQDKNPYALFEEALDNIAGQINLSDFDMDADGFVDNIHIIYAGYGEEAGGAYDAIWAHEQTFNAITVGNVKIDRYSCAPELRENRGDGISRIGPHCHEIGHALGAMDFYDTDYNESGGNYSGTGNWDVMAGGSWNDMGINPANFNPYVKAYNFGWSEVLELNEEGKVSINPSSVSNMIYRINTPVENEYYLLENREKYLFDSACPGEGLLIFHIGPNIDSDSRRNKINISHPQQCYVICASSSSSRPSLATSSYGQINSEGCPYPGSSGNNSFSPSSVPSASCLNGESCNFALNDISYTNKIITLRYSADTGYAQPPTDNIPEEGSAIWTENFSGNNIGDYWTQSYDSGNCNWKRSVEFEGNSLLYFMELEYGLSLGWFERLYSATSLTTQISPLNSTDYILSYDAKHIGDVSYNDSIKIYTKDDVDSDWSYVSSKEVSSDSWTTNSVKIHTRGNSISLCISGIVHRQAGLRISNIVLKETTPSKITPQLLDSNTSVIIYSLSGKIVSGNNLPKGIYIIREPNGKTSKKIISQ